MLDLIPDPILPPLPNAEYRTMRASIAELGVQVPLLLTCEGRRFTGCEIDPKLVKAARTRVAAALAGRQEELQPEFATV